jgi:D-3-phosphoglycerate dehydrogenase
MDELLELCDIVSLHMPATDDTKQLVNEQFLNKMKHGAMLINTSRGELVNEKALLDAIENKGIRAGLDVYDNEPGASDNQFNSTLANHNSVCGTHHIGASTDQAQIAVSDGVLQVIAAFQNGDLKNCVN